MLIRNTPEEMGLHPDGSLSAFPPHKIIPPARFFTKIVHDPKAYALGIAFGLALMCGPGVMSQLKPRFADAGISPYPAIILACVSALCAGFLPPTLLGLILFCITFGCCIGELWTVLPAVTAFYFGSDFFAGL